MPNSHTNTEDPSELYKEYPDSFSEIQEKQEKKKRKRKLQLLLAGLLVTGAVAVAIVPEGVQEVVKEISGDMPDFEIGNDAWWGGEWEEMRFEGETISGVAEISTSYSALYSNPSIPIESYEELIISDFFANGFEPNGYELFNVFIVERGVEVEGVTAIEEATHRLVKISGSGGWVLEYIGS